MEPPLPPPPVPCSLGPRRMAEGEQRLHVVEQLVRQRKRRCVDADADGAASQSGKGLPS